MLVWTVKWSNQKTWVWKKPTFLAPIYTNHSKLTMNAICQIYSRIWWKAIIIKGKMRKTETIWMWLMTIFNIVLTRRSQIGWYQSSIWILGVGPSTGCSIKTLRGGPLIWRCSIIRGCCKGSNRRLWSLMLQLKVWRDGWKWGIWGRKVEEGKLKTLKWRRICINGINILKNKKLNLQQGWSRTKLFNYRSVVTLSPQKDG